MINNCSFSADGRLFLFSDAESMVLVESATGRPLGYAVSEDEGLTNAAIAPDGSMVVSLEKTALVVRKTPLLHEVTRIAVREGAPFIFANVDRLVTVLLGKGDTPDDEIVAIDVQTGRLVQALSLTLPVPDSGLARRISGLPRGNSCPDDETCNNQEMEPEPVGRRVEELKVTGDFVAAAWRGGSSSLHRISDGKLIGAFRPRGETWKSGLITLQPKPPRAALATSPKVIGSLGPPLSVTALVDLDTGRISSILDECRWVSDLAFSESGDQLAVGDLRSACVHDARSGRFLYKTATVRDAWKLDDDLQDVVISRLGTTRWFLATADGSWAVMEGTDGRLVAKGFGSDLAIF